MNGPKPGRTGAARAAWPALACLAVLLAGTPLSAARPPAARPAPASAPVEPAAGVFRQYDSPFYTIHTDLPASLAPEIQLRLTRMAEEYQRRTADFARKLPRKLPFYLFRQPDDYHAAGGPKGSAGVFTGGKLMAQAGSSFSGFTWHVVQHEGFHQYARETIGDHIPVWLNEGLAEYFGQSLLTGASFVSGLVPPDRLARVQRSLANDEFRPIRLMLTLPHEEWNRDLRQANYDQAWAMVQFLLHGEDGKYARGFNAFVADMSRGTSAARAWQKAFGDAAGFQALFTRYWSGLPADPTRDLYASAAVTTLVQFLARATAEKQTFASARDLLAAIGQGTLRQRADDALPASLLGNVAAGMRRGDKLLLEPAPADSTAGPALVLAQPDGVRWVGSFALRGPRVDRVTVDKDELPRILAQARALAGEGKMPEARRLLLPALGKFPRSVALAEARQFLAQPN